jgi:hypothetical protein
MIHKAIIVWEFHNAPEEYRRLSGHGGDEDWLAFVPDSLKDAYIGWLDYGPFGCCDVSTHPVDGGVVKIGAHA